MATPDPPLEDLYARISQRLNKALDAHGYTYVLVERAKELGRTCRLDPQITTGWLTGHLAPTLPQLVDLAARLQREPGYFLDKDGDEFPPGTMAVPCLNIGEPMAIRFPSDLLGAAEARRGLVYLRATRDLGFNVKTGDYVFAFARATDLAVAADRLYLFWEDRFHLRVCTRLTAGQAIFASEKQADVPAVRNLAPQEKLQDFSEVVGVFRTAPYLRP